MKNIRLGNDILFVWGIYYSDGTFIDLSSLDLTLYLITPTKRIQLHDYTIKDGKIYWNFYGKDQEQYGEYSMTLVVNQGSKKMLTVDAFGIFRLLSYVDASTIMINQKQTYTVEETTVTNITPISPIIPVIGKNGTWVISGKDTGVKAVGNDGKSAFEIWRSMEGNEEKSEADFMDWLRSPNSEVLQEVQNQIAEINDTISTMESKEVVLLSMSDFESTDKLDKNKVYYICSEE